MFKGESPREKVQGKKFKGKSSREKVQGRKFKGESLREKVQGKKKGENSKEKGGISEGRPAA